MKHTVVPLSWKNNFPNEYRDLLMKIPNLEVFDDTYTLNLIETKQK